MDKFIRAFTSLWDRVMDRLPEYAWGFVRILAVVLLAWLGFVVLRRLLVGFIHRLSASRAIPTNERKLNTVLNFSVLLLRLFVVFLAVVAIFSILNLTGVLTSVIATAGVGGLVIAFGVQSLVKDFIAGLLLTAEDQITLGDSVEVNGVSGTVEGITMRTVQIRGSRGELHTIHAGSITKVTNHSRRDSLALADITLPAGTSIPQAMALTADAAAQWARSHPKLLRDAPQVMGLSLQEGEPLVIRVLCQAQPASHWEAEQQLRSYLTDSLRESGLDPVTNDPDKEG